MKKQEMQLSNYCRWDDNRSLVKLLKQHPDIDLTIKEGICFAFAIKYKNLDMLNTLLDHYGKTQLQGDRDSMEYKFANYKLKQILQDAVNSFAVSPEIEERLNPYIQTNEDSDSEQDLEGFEECEFTTEDISQDSTIIGDESHQDSES